MYNILKKLEKKTRHATDEAFAFLLAFAILAPWTMIGYATDAAKTVSQNGIAPYAYAESYSSVSSSVTSNGTTIVKSAESSGTSSAGVSVNNTLNNSDSTITVNGEVVETKTETKVDTVEDKAHISVLTELLEKLKELFALLTKAA